MSTTTLNTKFQLRRDDENVWTTVNPVLAEGEPVLSKVEGVYKLKIGDGQTPFSNLPYYGGGGSGDADWVTLLNKPFYEKQIAEQTIIIDYTEGLVPNTEEMIAIKKISSEVYSAEEIKQFTFSYDVLSHGSIETVTNAKATDENMKVEPVSTSVVFEETLFISTNTPGLTLDFGTLPEAGTYALYLGNTEDGIRLNSFTIPAHTELKKIDKKFLHLDWADVENKPFGEVQVPATHYDLSDTSKYTDIVDATEYGEYGDFYKLSNQQAYFNQLMQDGFSIDYKLNGELYIITSTDCVMTPHDLAGNVVSSTENGNYMEITYTDTDGDVILKFLLIYYLPDNTNEITYNGETAQVSYGDIYIAKYIKKVKTSDIEHPTMKIVEPIKVYTTPSYSFNQNETPITLMGESFYKVTSNTIPSADMINLKGYICNGTESSVSSGLITQGNASDFGDNATVDGFEIYYIDSNLPFLQATKDHATVEFDSEGEHVSLELPTQGIYFMRTEAEGNIYCVKSIGVNIESNFSELSGGYFEEGEFLDNELVFLYNIGELNLTINDWKNAIDFGMISYDIKNYDPSDPETYNKSSTKEEFDEKNTWEERADELFTEDYDYLGTVFQIKKPNVEYEGITFENPGVYLLKMIDEDVIMEAYLDLPARESVQKLNNKYIDFNWNNLENKPFGVIATYPATTYEMTEPFPQDYFVYSSQDGNEQKLYSSSFPQIKSSEDQIHITLSIETDGVSSSETYTAADLIQSQQTDENNYPYVLIEIARSGGNLPIAVMNPNSENSITYNNQSIAPGFYAIKTTLTTINNDLSGFSTTVITPQRIYSNAELTYTGDYSGTPDVSFIGGDLYRIGDYQSADLTQKYFGIETMSEGSSTTNYYMPTNMTQNLLSGNENNSFDNGTIYGFENADGVMVVNVSQDNSSLIFYENSDTEGEDPTRIEVTFNAGLYATRKFTDASNYQEIKTIGQDFDMNFISLGQSPVYTINNNMAIKTAYFNYGKLSIYSKDQFVNGTATIHQDGTTLNSITLNETNFIEKEDYFLYKNNEDIIFIVCNNNHKTYAEEVDEELSQGLYLGMSGTVDSEGLHLAKVAINTNAFEDIKKLDEKFLPDNIGGGSGSSSGGNSGSAGVTSWNDLTDKPFELVHVEQFNITKDLPSVTRTITFTNGSDTSTHDLTLYKISDEPYTEKDWGHLSTGEGNYAEIIPQIITFIGDIQTEAGSQILMYPGYMELISIAQDNDIISASSSSLKVTGIDDLEKGFYIGESLINSTEQDNKSLFIEAQDKISYLDNKYIKSLPWSKIENVPFGTEISESTSKTTYTLDQFQYCGGDNPTITCAFQYYDSNAKINIFYYRVRDALTIKQLKGLSITRRQKAYIDNSSESYQNSEQLYTYNKNPQLIIRSLPNSNDDQYGIYYKAAGMNAPLIVNIIKKPTNGYIYYKAPWSTEQETLTGSATSLESGLYVAIQPISEKYNYISRIIGSSYNSYYKKLTSDEVDFSAVNTELSNTTKITDNSNNTTQTLEAWTRSVAQSTSGTLRYDQSVATDKGVASLYSYIDSRAQSTYPGYITSTTKVGGVETSNPTLDTWVTNKITTNQPYVFNVSSEIPASGTPNTTITFIV